MLAACSSSGAGEGETQSSRSVPATTTSPSTGTSEEPDLREISVTFGGRTIAGECVGESVEGAPTVVLDSGMENDRSQLQTIGDVLVDRTMVCSYDRAGNGASDPPASVPRSITDVVEDMHAFLSDGNVAAPYFLMGQSQGGADVLMFAVTYPDEVAGLVSMNPGAPSSLFLRSVARVMTPEELDAEVAFAKGENPEGIDIRPTSKLTRATLPSSMPYAVMYALTCAGDDFCERVRPVERKGEAVLAEVKDADHEIWLADMDVVLQTIDEVWTEATD